MKKKVFMLYNRENRKCYREKAFGPYDPRDVSLFTLVDACKALYILDPFGENDKIVITHIDDLMTGLNDKGDQE